MGRSRPSLAGSLPLTASGRLLLGLLWVVDLALVLAHLSLKYVGQPSGWTFDLGAERSYGELVQYLKYAWTALLLVLLAFTRRELVFLAWALLFLCLGADDWFGLHERAGEWASERWGDLGGWVWHLGELGFLVAVLGVFLAIAVPLHQRSTGEGRRVSWSMFGLAAVLGGVGVGVDAVHHLVFDGQAWADVPFTVLEDGGELVILSLITAFLFGAAQRAMTPSRG